MQATDYAYAVGKIRALERFLIRQEVFEDAAGAPLQDALRLFAESDLYGEELLHVSDSFTLEQVLEAETRKLKNTVRPLILDDVLQEALEIKGPGHLLLLVGRSNSIFLREFFLQMVDLHNIKTYLRMMLLHEPPEKLREHLACQGFIPCRELLDCYGKELAVFLHRLSNVHAHGRLLDYARFLKEGIEKAVNESSFVSLESALQGLLVRFLKPAKYMSFGPEPVVAYYFAKMNELGLIRMIILAKLNNASAELIEESLHGVYA